MVKTVIGHSKLEESVVIFCFCSARVPAGISVSNHE